MDESVDPAKELASTSTPNIRAGRRRSQVVLENPFENPLNADEQSVANLVRTINQNNERVAQREKIHQGVFQGQSQPRLATPKMSYNYMESVGPSNPRQAPPSPSQNMAHGNGMNGGGMVPGMVGYPTPAGHQSDLNYIMGMIDEFSLITQGNQRLTAGVIDKIGKVTERAKALNLNNNEVIGLVSKELEDEAMNLEKELSEMRKKLQKAEYDADENWKLVIHGCNILADILEKVHKFKETNERDVLAWHKNYRNQLAYEREQNLALNNQINDMRAAACRANEHLRGLRRALTDDEDRHEREIVQHALRLEKRSWKRMALPMMAEDDSEFSDDDDLSDPIIKRRLRQLIEKEVERVKRKTAEGKARREGQASATGNAGSSSAGGSGDGDNGPVSAL